MSLWLKYVDYVILSYVELCVVNVYGGKKDGVELRSFLILLINVVNGKIF